MLAYEKIFEIYLIWVKMKKMRGINVLFFFLKTDCVPDLV